MKLEDMKIMIIDGNNLYHRAFWSSAKKRDCSPTYHLFMFLRELESYAELFRPIHTIVCWDFKEEKVQNFRNCLNPEYKGQRNTYNIQSVYEYIPVLFEVLNCLGISQINPLKLEADDIIYWLSSIKYPNHSVVVSNDSDFFQLVSDETPDNIIYHPKKRREITQIYLRKYHNVSFGSEYIVQKALIGDWADNIDGIKGISKDRIQKVLGEVGQDYNLDKLRNSAILSPDEMEIFERNLKLMRLDVSNISKEEIEWYEKCLSERPAPNLEGLKAILKELDFLCFYRKAEQWINKFSVNVFS